jgi:ferredoxin
MAHVICEPCEGVKSAKCVVVCPTEAIGPRPDASDYNQVPQLYIDPGVCTDCGLCVGECPVSAIYAADEVPAQWESYIGRNQSFFGP